MKPFLFFRSFPVLRREIVSLPEASYETVKITFGLPTNQRLGVDIGKGERIKVKGPKGKPKSYSPTSDPTVSGSFDLTVKVYSDRDGTSKYLGGLNVGDTARISGPWPVFKFMQHYNPAANVGMIIFGVGITEGLPVAQEELARGAKVLMLWANRGRQEVLPWYQDQLTALEEQYPGQFTLKHIFSRRGENGSSTCQQELSNVLSGRVTADVLPTVFPFIAAGQTGKDRFLCVGTKPMMRDAWAMLATYGYDRTAHSLIRKRSPREWLQWK